MTRFLLRWSLRSVLLLALLAVAFVRPGRAGDTAPVRSYGLAWLMPVPASVTPGEGRFRIDEDLRTSPTPSS